MTPARVDGGRVLELGCASGGNLISMAVSVPQTYFLGVDLSREQIAAGQGAVRARTAQLRCSCPNHSSCQGRSSWRLSGRQMAQESGRYPDVIGRGPSLV
jgi:hypothetical protein